MTLKSLLSRMFPPLHGYALLGACVGVAIVCVAIFFLLRALPPRARKTLIRIATFAAGFFYAIEFFWPANKATRENPLTFAVLPVGSFLTILITMTLGLGIINLTRIHLGISRRQKKGWGNSVVLLVAMIVMALYGLIDES